MQILKKAVAMIMVMLITISLLVPVVNAAESPTLRVSSASISSGGLCSVSVSLENNPGIIAARLSVIYDKTALTLKSAGDSGLLNGKVATPSPDILYWEDALATENNSANGIAVTLTFAVNSGTPSGKYPISIGYTAGDIYNLDLTDVNFTVVSGYITVISAECYHNDSFWQVTTQPTASSEGIRSEICADCGEVIKTEKIPATGNETGVCGELIWNYNSAYEYLEINGDGKFPDFTSSYLSQPWYLKKTKIKTVVFANNLDRIGNYAFSKHTALKNVVLPNDLSIIGDSAFLDCLKLFDIELPQSLQEIGNNAFYGCSDLTSINFPENLVSIGDSAFENCKGLSGVLRIKSAIYIGDNAFSGCNGLTAIVLPDNVGYIGNNVFLNDKIFCRMGSYGADAGYAIIGDLDGNKAFAANDLVLLKKELLYNSEYTVLADINEDGAFSLTDLVRFKKQLA